LKETFTLIKEKGYEVVNVDSTICLQEPKISAYVEAMQSVIASILQINTDAVSIKATTTENLGFVGRQEGIMAYATALLVKSVQ